MRRSGTRGTSQISRNARSLCEQYPRLLWEHLPVLSSEVRCALDTQIWFFGNIFFLTWIPEFLNSASHGSHGKSFHYFDWCFVLLLMCSVLWVVSRETGWLLNCRLFYETSIELIRQSLSKSWLNCATLGVLFDTTRLLLLKRFNVGILVTLLRVLTMATQEIEDTPTENVLLSKIIDLKIEVFTLKEKKRLLLEELYRQFFEGEKEPKKRKRREIKQDEAVSSNVDCRDAVSSTAINIVSKKRRRRGPIPAISARDDPSWQQVTYLVEFSSTAETITVISCDSEEIEIPTIRLFSTADCNS